MTGHSLDHWKEIQHRIQRAAELQRTKRRSELWKKVHQLHPVSICLDVAFPSSEKKSQHHNLELKPVWETTRLEPTGSLFLALLLVYVVESHRGAAAEADSRTTNLTHVWRRKRSRNTTLVLRVRIMTMGLCSHNFWKSITNIQKIKPITEKHFTTPPWDSCLSYCYRPC